MATLTIRNLPDEVRDRLRVAAAKHGRSMEAEARATLINKFGANQHPGFDVEAITREVQDAFAPYRAKEGSVVDELIAERRIEAWRETLEALHDLSRHGKPDMSRWTDGSRRSR
jgi:plasmid stability protein